MPSVDNKWHQNDNDGYIQSCVKPYGFLRCVLNHYSPCIILCVDACRCVYIPGCLSISICVYLRCVCVCICACVSRMRDEEICLPKFVYKDARSCN